MRAILIAVGSEMLEKDRVDTNSIYIAKELMKKGILVDMKMIVGDDMENLTWIVKKACKRTQVVIITGGLGPTEDDITREAVANAVKKELEFNEEILAGIQERFKKRGLAMPQINTRQAFVIKDSQVIPNSRGTAPGLYIDDESCRLLLLPGPPLEMQPMLDLVLEEKIAPLCNFRIYTRCFKFGNITESKLDSMISELYTKYKNPSTTILSTPGLIEVHLLGRSRKSPEEARVPTDELAEKIKEKLKDYLITEKDISIEEHILEELKSRNLTLSVAESCTGGGLGNRITNIPGSSEVFLGGVIVYSNELKMKLLGVKENTLIKHGAVSKETAKEMARGVRELTGADIGVSITGIAGPGGAAPKKPVGLVFMHLTTADTDMGLYQILPGDRQMVKTRTINYSLNLIKEYLRTKDSA
jgi:nicotinamide-nucleotide amidase